MQTKEKAEINAFLFILGWIREVVYDREEDGKYKPKPKEVNYYAPLKSGIQKKFQAYSELRSYCKYKWVCPSIPTKILRCHSMITVKSTNSEFSLANFSFRMEPMNAMNGQEVTRASDEIPPFSSLEQPTKPVELL